MHQSSYPGGAQPGESRPTSEAEIPALPMALARMNSDNVTPRDLADWASTSRSCGRRRTATRAVRLPGLRALRPWRFTVCCVGPYSSVAFFLGETVHGRHLITREPLSGITARRVMLVDSSVARSFAVLGLARHLIQLCGGRILVADGVHSQQPGAPSELRNIRNALQRHEQGEFTLLERGESLRLLRGGRGGSAGGAGGAVTGGVPRRSVLWRRSA
jgi:hypothetical protein